MLKVSYHVDFGSWIWTRFMEGYRHLDGGGNPPSIIKPIAVVLVGHKCLTNALPVCGENIVEYKILVGKYIGEKRFKLSR